MPSYRDPIFVPVPVPEHELSARERALTYNNDDVAAIDELRRRTGLSFAKADALVTAQLHRFEEGEEF